MPNMFTPIQVLMLILAPTVIVPLLNLRYYFLIIRCSPQYVDYFPHRVLFLHRILATVLPINPRYFETPSFLHHYDATLPLQNLLLGPRQTVSDSLRTNPTGFHRIIDIDCCPRL